MLRWRRCTKTRQANELSNPDPSHSKNSSCSARDSEVEVRPHDGDRVWSLILGTWAEVPRGRHSGRIDLTTRVWPCISHRRLRDSEIESGSLARPPPGTAGKLLGGGLYRRGKEVSRGRKFRWCQFILPGPRTRFLNTHARLPSRVQHLDNLLLPLFAA